MYWTWCTPVIPATEVAEAGWLEPRSLRPAWATQTQAQKKKDKEKSVYGTHSSKASLIT